MFSQKVLCLGNNSIDTDQKVSLLAKENQTINHGLINDKSFIPFDFGYYHTSVVDLQAGEIIDLAPYFHNIMLLDQEQNKWSHPILFSATNKLIDNLRDLGYSVIYQNPNTVKIYNFFSELLEKNKSFCIIPFIHLISRGDGYTNICDKSPAQVAPLKNLDWANDVNYQKIRTNMLNGELNIPHCNYCYNIEKRGGKDARYFDTLEWVSILNITSLEDLKTIETPKYYSVRPSNKCNIRCRSCVPRDSHLIEKEFKTIGIEIDKEYVDYPGFEIVDFKNLKRLLVAGGEPTVMPEFYDFLQKCIDSGHTNFEFCINTNAVKFSDKLLNLLDHFTHFTPSISLDGIGKVNDYIRWGSEFDQIIKNTHKLVERGHYVAFITVVSIYNITSLHEVMEFQDSEFPGASVMLQFDEFKDDIQSPYNHPNTELALSSLEKCKKTKAYFNFSRGTKSIIDNLYDHYFSQPTVDIKKLKKFFEFNDKLDQSRGHKLVDYIPELEQARNYI